MMQQNFEFDVGKRFTRTSPANVSEKNTHFCKKVIIAAYMRTGYSLIGGMFHHKPGTFYLFKSIRQLFNLISDARNTTAPMFVSGKRRTE